MIQFCTQQLSRSCRRKFEHFRQIAQSYILLLASLLQYSTQLPWQIQRTLLWSLSHWTVFGIYLNSWTQKCKRLMTYDDFSACTVTIQTHMDLVDADFPCLYASGFDHCRLLHWCHRTFCFWPRTEPSSQISAALQSTISIFWTCVENLVPSKQFFINSLVFHCSIPLQISWMLLKPLFRLRTDLSTIGRGSVPYWRSSTLESRDAVQYLPSRSWIGVASSVEDIENGHLRNKCVFWDADFIRLKLCTTCWLGWDRIQSKSFMYQNY